MKLQKQWLYPNDGKDTDNNKAAAVLMDEIFKTAAAGGHTRKNLSRACFYIVGNLIADLVPSLEIGVTGLELDSNISQAILLGRANKKTLNTDTSGEDDLVQLPH